jgi:hypothetical protein
LPAELLCNVFLAAVVIAPASQPEKLSPGGLVVPGRQPAPGGQPRGGGEPRHVVAGLGDDCAWPPQVLARLRAALN